MDDQGQGGGKMLDVDGQGGGGSQKLHTFHGCHMCIIPKIFLMIISLFLLECA